MLAIQFSPKSSMIRQFTDGVRPWLEKQLGVSMGQNDPAPVLTTALSMIAASKLLPGVNLSGSEEGLQGMLEYRLQRIEFPPDSSPAIAMIMVPDTANSVCVQEKKLWRANWLDCPAALHIQGLPSPIVVINIPYVVGAGGEGGWREVVLVRQDSAQDVLTLVKQACSASHEPSLHCYHTGVRKVRPHTMG